MTHWIAILLATLAAGIGSVWLAAGLIENAAGLEDCASSRTPPEHVDAKIGAGVGTHRLLGALVGAHHDSGRASPPEAEQV